MPRLPRSITLEANSLVHKMWRGHNRDPIFSSNEEKYNYLHNLNSTISKEACELHAICLMSNHTHEVYFVKDVSKFSDFMRDHHSKFGQFYNKLHQRTGKVSEDRPKIVLIESEIHEMTSVFYIHANPIRANIVKGIDELQQYSSSSHLLYGYGIFEDWMRSIVLSKWYLALGSNNSERRRYYLHLFREYLNVPEEKFIQSITI